MAACRMFRMCRRLMRLLHPPCHTAQVFPVPPGVLLFTSAPKKDGYRTVSGSTGPLFLFSLGGAGSAGPTAFKHTCPKGTVVVGFEVSGSDGLSGEEGARGPCMPSEKAAAVVA